MVIFTSICSNYLHKARLLANSVKLHIPGARFIVCLVEREIINTITNSPDFDDIVLAKDIWEGDFDRFVFKHTIVEAATSVKGQFFRYLFGRYPDEEKFVYLDPDIYVYDDFVELRALLDTRPIIVCPHILEPGNIDMELSSLAHGVFNLGFLAVTREKEAVAFIEWWANRLSVYCYDDKANGIFTDQKWVSLAPCFFDVEIFKHRGYDFATWSLLNCDLTEKEGKYFVNGDPLRFIHFSGYGALLENCMDNWLPKGDHIFRRLFADYRRLHEKADSDNVSKTPWSYGCFSSGETIDDDVRRNYRIHHYSPDNPVNPFEQSMMIYANIKHEEREKPETVSVFKKAYRVARYEGLITLTKKIWRKFKCL